MRERRLDHVHGNLAVLVLRSARHAAGYKAGINVFDADAKRARARLLAALRPLRVTGDAQLVRWDQVAHAFPIKALRFLTASAASMSLVRGGFARGAERLRSGAASRAGSV